MCCVPARRNGRISSLTWAAYLRGSSLLGRRFEIPSHSLGSRISHTTQKKGKGEEEGRRRWRWRGGGGPADSHLSPASASQVPTGRHRLSVKSQVTTVWAEPTEGRHFISHLPDCLASIEIRKGKKGKIILQKGQRWQKKLRNLTHQNLGEPRVSQVCEGDKKTGSCLAFWFHRQIR